MPLGELKHKLTLSNLKKKFGGKGDEEGDEARKVLVEGKLQPIKHLPNEPDEQIAATSISPSLLRSPVPAVSPAASSYAAAGPASPAKGKGKAAPIDKSAISKAKTPASTEYYYDDSGKKTAAPSVNPHLGPGHVYERDMSPKFFYETARAAPLPPSRPQGLNTGKSPRTHEEVARELIEASDFTDSRGKGLPLPGHELPPPPPPPSAAAASATASAAAATTTAAAAATATATTAATHQVANDFAGLGISIPTTPISFPSPFPPAAPNTVAPGGPDLWELPSPTRKPQPAPLPSYFAVAGSSASRYGGGGDAAAGPAAGTAEGAARARGEYKGMLEELHRRAKARREERWEASERRLRILRGEEERREGEEDELL